MCVRVRVCGRKKNLNTQLRQSWRRGMSIDNAERQSHDAYTTNSQEIVGGRCTRESSQHAVENDRGLLWQVGANAVRSHAVVVREAGHADKTKRHADVRKN